MTVLMARQIGLVAGHQATRSRTRRRSVPLRDRRRSELPAISFSGSGRL